MNDFSHLPDNLRPRRLQSARGLTVERLWHGGLRAITWQGLTVNLFPGTAAQAGPANLWLRRLGADGLAVDARALLGPGAVLRPKADPVTAAGSAPMAAWQGEHAGLAVELALQLADSPDGLDGLAWHLRITNHSPEQQTVDLLALQDVGLSRWGAMRLNEFYVSQYVDLQPLRDPLAGWSVAARQNQAVDGRHPWCLMGSLGHAVSLATDAWQFFGTALRAGDVPPALRNGLPGERLQHEHALLALQESPIVLDRGAVWQGGFFLVLQADHPQASAAADLAWVRAARRAWPAPWAIDHHASAAPRGAMAGTLFSGTPWLTADELSAEDLARNWPVPRLHEERDADGHLLSFFSADGSHIVLREKERRVRRPHGHLLRSGRHLTPDESALTSTVWMAGGFHSMLTQGHVGINRCLSTVRSALGLYRGQGQRVFVSTDGHGWQQLGLPSAFEIADDRCRWWYRHAGGLILAQAWAEHGPHAMGLSLEVLEGAPLHWRVTHDVVLGDEDHWPPRPLAFRVEHDRVVVDVPPGSELAARFPQGSLHLQPEGSMAGVTVADDAALYADGLSRGEPMVVIDRRACRRFALRLLPRLVEGAVAPPQDELPLPQWTPAASGADPGAVLALQRLAQIVPWFARDALVHYLSPRGLEQFSGGGWGTRDVCQGPLEMLLALDRQQPARDLLCRVFSAQNAGGDWPQWFMFFERERHIRAGDAHGDIVFWPLLALARYLVVTEDASLLDEPLPFYARAGEPVTVAPLGQHVERAWAVVRGRRLAGTQLVNYGHGDWNDSLQPADPSWRDRLCSSWTVTLHHQVLRLMARGLAAIGQGDRAQALGEEAGRLQADFRRLLLRDGTVAGYALFGTPGDPPALLLHPADQRTGVRHSLLPLMHAVMEDLLTPDEARAQLRLIESRLMGPDGARLFDRPLAYRGGPMRIFQRAESSSFFGREIGVMYMHAHLRYAEMLAHLGEADRLLDALQRIHPIGLSSVVPTATRRQSNCYYSSSDAAFADRYGASAQYGRIQAGTVALDGGWRVYSSGPGLALGLLVSGFLGLRREGQRLSIDPVIPASLRGLRAQATVDGLRLDLEFLPGPKGHGPTAVHVAGAELPPGLADRLPHAYRTGGLSVPLRALHERALDGAVRISVTTG